MSTEIRTAADLNKLPSHLLLSLRSIGQTTGGLFAYKTSAERKASIQQAARKAVKDQAISLDLAVEILQTNGAYGAKGRAALAA